MNLLSYFPLPYPRELFYSIIARYQDHTLLSRYEVCRTLFDADRIQSNLIFPTRISYLANNIKGVIKLDANYFIEQHTLYPLISQFLTPIKRELFRQQLHSLSSKHNLNFIRGFDSKIISYCPHCILFKLAINGEMHWELIHNIPFVDFCYKHFCRLEKWSPSEYFRRNSGFFSAEKYLKDFPDPVFDSKYPQDIVAEELLSIFNNKRSFDFNKVLDKGLTYKFIRRSGGMKIYCNPGFVDKLSNYVNSFGEKYHYSSKKLAEIVPYILNGRYPGTHIPVYIFLEDFFSNPKFR